MQPLKLNFGDIFTEWTYDHWSLRYGINILDLANYKNLYLNKLTLNKSSLWLDERDQWG